MKQRPFPVGRAKSPGQSAGFLLWQATNLWQRRMKAALAPFGLTHVQFVLLAGLCWLEQDKGTDAVTQNRLAAFCATDPMMTSQVLRTLERARLVERLAHPGDARARDVKLSDEGYKKLVDTVEAVEAIDADVFAKLGARQGNFTESLRQLLG